MLVIILGAGASHDCVSINEGYHNEVEYKPPLVSHLFDPKKARFADILTNYRRAQQAASDIQPAVSSNAIALEKYLKTHLKESQHASDRLAYIQVPMYLQELLWQVGRSYTKHPTNYDKLVNRIVRSNKVLIITLNYDVIIDNRLFTHRKLDSLDNYINDANWSLIKLHGSINWVKKIDGMKEPPEIMAHSEKYAGRVTSLGDNLPLSEQIYIKGHDSLSNLRTDASGGVYYPALSVPLGEDDEVSCPSSHLDFARKQIAEAENIDLLSIGYSGNDNEVINLLTSGCNKINKINIVVGNDPQAGFPFLRKIATHFNINVSRTAHCVKTKGFDKWASSGYMDDFFEVN